ncbi:MAG: NUDIX hydrolase [Ignavibacteriae bacterium]|jgi:ADP-ribose pyrophosphatase|nr:NUDIX hydrolase [Ignavibacteriota bacterium]NOG98743.1 NUDIX hydrolase [Ignavibacteriota bacterium]
MRLKKWNKLSERLFHDNGFWKYKIDEFEIEGSQKGEYHYVFTLGSSMVIPLSNKNTIMLVKQYRYLNQKDSLEFPCGSITEGLTEKENAQKELREETGYSAAILDFVGEFSPYTGVSNEMCSVFIGSNLAYSPLPNDATEEFELVEYSFDDIDKMISENIIWDGLTICAWTIARNRISDLLSITK